MVFACLYYLGYNNYYSLQLIFIMTIVLVLVIRLLVPISIFRWPFWGVVISILADAADVVLFDRLGWGVLEGLEVYHEIDKLLDIYYLSFAMWAAWQWPDKLAKQTALALFVWRLLGVALFTFTHIRQIILLAPNIFENFYLLAAGLYLFRPLYRLDNKKKIITLLLIGAIPKLVQEYVMHFKEFPTWLYIRNHILMWQ